MKLKMMAGTLSIMVMLSTPTLAQAQVTKMVPLMPLRQFAMNSHTTTSVITGSNNVGIWANSRSL